MLCKVKKTLQGLYTLLSGGILKHWLLAADFSEAKSFYRCFKNLNHFPHIQKIFLQLNMVLLAMMFWGSDGDQLLACWCYFGKDFWLVSYSLI